LEFVVAVLRCGQCVVGWWSSDGLDAREDVDDNVVLARDVPYICHELSGKV
jgi:hypothetical protein